MIVFGDGNNDLLRKATAITTTAAVVGTPTDCRNVTTLSIQFVTTDSTGVQGGGSAGGVAGTWKIEVSNSISLDPDQIKGGIWNKGLWTDISADTRYIGTAVPASTGTGQNYVTSIIDFPFRHIRVTFTPTGGTGSTQQAWAYALGKSDGN